MESNDRATCVPSRLRIDKVSREEGREQFRFLNEVPYMFHSRVHLDGRLRFDHARVCVCEQFFLTYREKLLVNNSAKQRVWEEDESGEFFLEKKKFCSNEFLLRFSEDDSEAIFAITMLRRDLEELSRFR